VKEFARPLAVGDPDEARLKHSLHEIVLKVAPRPKRSVEHRELERRHRVVRGEVEEDVNEVEHIRHGAE